MTVYRCLNGKGCVGEKTRKRINDYIRRHHYRPNQTARSLRLKKTNIIGLAVPSFAFSYYPEIIESIRRTLGKKYNLLLSLSDDEDAGERAALEMLLDIPVDGILLSPTGTKRSLANCRFLRKQQTPFVLFDRYFLSVDEFPVVSTDCFTASKQLISHLASLGHRKIAHIGGNQHDSFARLMFEGYKAGLAENRIEYDKRLVLHGTLDEKFAAAGMKLLLESGVQFTAVHAGNDPVAIGVLDLCQEKDIAIPGDLSVTGFSDVYVAKHLRVPLTTVREPTREIGKLAANILINEIEKTPDRHDIKILLPGEFIQRASTGAV